MANTGNSQQQINTGTTANDGTGDPLRTAFIKTDHNFDAIYLAGPVGTNVRISGNSISTLQVNQDLALTPNGVANVRINNNTIPGANNTHFLGSATNRWRGAFLGSGGLSVTGDVTVTGNVTAGNIAYTGNVFVGDLQGSVFADDSTLIVDSINNAIYADEAYLSTVAVSGNITGNNINAVTSLGLPVYANTTVRDSSIASPQPGMMIFVTGTGLQVRGATAWNTVSGTTT